MRRSKTLKRLRSNEPVRLCALGHFMPAFICHAAEFGFDCIWLDLEHRAMTDREVQSLLSLFHLYDIDCMLRPATLEKSRLYRYLEDGAAGLMIPHVSTPEKAQMLVDAVKFPPLGDRGLDGSGLDARFLHERTADYTTEANRETFLVVQIETPQAVANVAEIASIEGIDGLFVGPADLSLRLKYDDSGLTMEEACHRVAAAAKLNGKAWGRPVDTVEDLQRVHKQGAQLAAFGNDFVAVMAMLKECAAGFDALSQQG